MPPTRPRWQNCRALSGRSVRTVRFLIVTKTATKIEVLDRRGGQWVTHRMRLAPPRHSRGDAATHRSGRCTSWERDLRAQRRRQLLGHRGTCRPATRDYREVSCWRARGGRVWLDEVRHPGARGLSTFQLACARSWISSGSRAARLWTDSSWTNKGGAARLNLATIPSGSRDRRATPLTNRDLALPDRACSSLA